MLPVVPIIGRPNVGKSTLFNRLTKSRDALVYDKPGVTRDRKYGRCTLNGVDFFAIDTAGILGQISSDLEKKIDLQIHQAMFQGDCVIFLVDGRAGLCSSDIEIARELRKIDKLVLVGVNKLEGMTDAVHLAEFHELGFERLVAISSSHGDGIGELLREMKKGFRLILSTNNVNKDEQGEGVDRISLAVIGRPNVGKSTTVNKLLGEERVVTCDMPGTTRDTVRIPFSWNSGSYSLIDTAGIRKKTKISDLLEKFVVLKTLEIIKQSNVVILVLDGSQGITDQDLHIASLVQSSGCALVVGVNKWDKISINDKSLFKMTIDRKLRFLHWARIHFFSAIKGFGIKELMASVRNAYNAALTEISTSMLNSTLRQLTSRHPPPFKSGFRPKLRYAHQGGRNPPVIVIHGSGLKHINKDYVKYLENGFRQECRMFGTPLRITLRNSTNPYLKLK